MTISDVLIKTLKYCAEKNVDFQMIGSDYEKNDYTIDEENKKVVITLIDPTDKEFLKTMKNNLKRLKEVFH